MAELMDPRLRMIEALMGRGGLPDYGFGPVTSLSRAGIMPQGELRKYAPTAGEEAAYQLRSLGPVGERVSPVASALLDYGPEPARAYVRQIDRAAGTLSEATDDPSLANVTNAGVQTALTFGRPVAAGATLGAGMLEAARRDFAPDLAGSAAAEGNSLQQLQEQKALLMQQRQEALSRRESNRPAGRAPTRTGDPNFTAANNELSGIDAKLDALDAMIADEQRKNDPAYQLEIDRRRKEQGEYNRSVGRAEAARDAELKRKRRFSDTEMGKVYEATGGALPIAAALGAGAAGRLAHGNNALGRYVLPTAEGAGAALATTSIPLLYDYQTDSDNPEKAAYLAYSRELPPGHPRKQEYADYAHGLPDRNPVQQQAQEQFFNPYRMGMSGVEGGLGGVLGSTLVGVPARGGNAILRALIGRQRPSGPSPTSQAPQARVITRILAKDGRTLYQSERGRFTSPPKRNP